MATAVLLLLLEGVLRVGVGMPRGYFHYLTDSDTYLWRPSVTFDVLLGPFPYTITTNRHGFRGPDFPRERTPGVVRIACLGDSVTLGFFVDNDQTYPAYLRQLLAAQGIDSEVVNAAPDADTPAPPAGAPAPSASVMSC